MSEPNEFKKEVAGICFGVLLFEYKSPQSNKKITISNFAHYSMQAMIDLGYNIYEILSGNILNIAKTELEKIGYKGSKVKKEELKIDYDFGEVQVCDLYMSVSVPRNKQRSTQDISNDLEKAFKSAEKQFEAWQRNILKVMVQKAKVIVGKELEKGNTGLSEAAINRLSQKLVYDLSPFSKGAIERTGRGR